MNRALYLPSPLPKIKVWVAAALLFAAVLALYYGWLGFTYWQSWSRQGELGRQVQENSVSLQKRAPDRQAAERDLAASEAGLAATKALFALSDPDSMTGVVLAAARRAGAGVVSLSVGELSAVVQEKVQYRTLPVSLTLSGDTAAVFRFLSELREETEAVSVSNVRLGGLDATPAAQLQLVFYLTPQEIKEASTASPTPKIK